MTYLSNVLRALQGLPPKGAQSAQPPKAPEAPAIPKGVDLSALWEDPKDASMLPVILAGASVVFNFIILMIVIFKH